MDTKPTKKPVVPTYPKVFEAQAIALVLEGGKPSTLSPSNSASVSAR